MGDHTEAISIDFDPTIVSYNDLLQHFWTGHRCEYNNTSRQYMNAIFYRDEEQQAVAKESLKERAKQLHIDPKKVATKILPFTHFTYAENYHQKYALSHPVRDFLEQTYPSSKSFADSTVAMKLTVYQRSDLPKNWEQFLLELPEYGLPETLEQEFKQLAEKHL